jgi:hypothetical protein
VSSGAANVPDWAGLIDSGVAYAESVSAAGGPPLCTPDRAAAIRADLGAGRLTEAAAHVKAMLGAPSGEYARWLRQTFGVARDRVTRHSTLNAVADLLCPLLATTNYDRLLSDFHPDRPPPVTWRQAVPLQIALRDGGHVVHLHGVFDEPESVVFGVQDYADLVAHGGYRAILQTLWLDRVLLFVGCSFEGLRDPDFAALRAWAAREFAGRPYRHYALRRTGSFDAEEAVRLLREERIHVLSFGPEFGDLPPYLEGLNPRRTEARRHRLELAVQITGMTDTRPDGDREERVKDLLRGILVTAAQDHNEAAVAAVARQLLEDKQRRHAMWRADLQALQLYVAGIVSAEELRRQVDLWEARQVKRYEGAFADTVRRARQALGLLVPQFLADLHRRGVPISSTMLDGYALTYVDDLERGVLLDAAYPIENAKRVLQSALAFLEADPALTFPAARVGTGTVAELANLLLVVREDRLELRELPDGGRAVAVLPADEGLREAEVANLEGRRVIVGRGDESLFAWDPVRAPSPVKEFRIAEAFGTFAAAHFVDREGALRSFLVTVQGTLHELRDLEERARWTPAGESLQSLACLPDGRLFALRRSHLPVVEVLPQREVVVRLDAEALDRVIAALPGLEQYWPEKLQRERERARALGASRDDADRYRHVYLKTAELDGRAVLLLKVTLDFLTGDDDAVLAWTPGPEGLTPLGGLYLASRRILGFVAAAGPDGRPRLFYARLSDFQETYDLVEWARGTPTFQGYMFQIEGSAIRTRDDMVRVEILDFDVGFASDDSGGLFRFSPSTREFHEVDRDRQSRIRDLKLVGPPVPIAAPSPS